MLGDDTSRLEQQILMPFPLKKYVSKPESKVRSGRGKGSRGWFCAAYQKKECPHKENHQVEVNGKTLLAQHICTSCWLNDKVKAQHSDSSPKCPHYEH